MNRRVRLAIGKLVSPFVIAGLKIHTRITGQERSRTIICNQYDEILLVRGMIGPSWSLPGGGIEKNETPIQAAIREMYEETGILSRDATIELVGILDKNDSPVNYTAHVFRVDVDKKALPEVQFNPREIIELGWFNQERLPDDLSVIVRPCLNLLSKERDV